MAKNVSTFFKTIKKFSHSSIILNFPYVLNINLQKYIEIIKKIEWNKINHLKGFLPCGNTKNRHMTIVKNFFLLSMQKSKKYSVCVFLHKMKQRNERKHRKILKSKQEQLGFRFSHLFGRRWVRSICSRPHWHCVRN